MEIPTAVIRRLQSSLREAAGAPSSLDTAPAPPFPSVADAVAAFDAGASASAPAELRCGRCGGAGGLLRGARSALCAYCGSPRRGEDGECQGGGIAFRDGLAYRWLLGSLGLDGSELVEFDNESTGSNKSKDAPKSGMIVSDLLDLKLTSLPEKNEVSGSSISKEQPSNAYTPNLSGVDAESFFIERKEETTAAAAAFPQARAVVREKQTTDSKSLESSRSEMQTTSAGLMTSQKTNQVEPTPAFANWDAEFQSASSESAAGDSGQVDLFKGTSAAESFNFPTAVTAINPVVVAGNKTNIESAILEPSEPLDSMDATLVKDNLFDQKVVQPILESNSGIATENSAPDFIESSLNKNSLNRDELHERDDTGVKDDEDFDDWQDFTGGENLGSLSNAGEHKEKPPKRGSFEMKTIDPWPLGSRESPNNLNNDSDDWQAFASSSGQGRQDLVKSMEGSTSGQGGGSVRLVEETISSTSFEHPSQSTSVDLWPMGVDNHRTTEMIEETNDSFDDWQDFTTSGQVQNTSVSQTGDMMEVLTVSQKEINLDSWFMGDSREAKNTDLVNENNAVLNDWQGFTGSGQSQQNISKNQFEKTDSVRLNGSKKDATNTFSTNLDGDGFDIWQDFAKSGQATTISPEPAKEIDAMDLWLTSNSKESNNSEGVRRIDEPSGGWQDFASFGQTQSSTEIPGDGHLVKDPPLTETLTLWASSNTEEKKPEQIGGTVDLFDNWQDFKNSGETTLQVFSDVSSLDRPSAPKPDALEGLEFGSVSGLASSQNQEDENESSNVAKAVPFDEHWKSMNGMQQMGDIDSLSAILPTKDATSESEPADANVGKLLSQMHDLSFMLKDELSVPDKPVDHSKS